MTRDEWLDTGQRLGYCTPTMCAIHDGVLTDTEWEAYYEAGESEQPDDLCAFVVRLLDDRPTIDG